MPDQDNATAVLDKPQVDLGALNSSPAPAYYAPVNVNLAEHNDQDAMSSHLPSTPETMQEPIYQQPSPEQTPPTMPPPIQPPSQFGGESNSHKKWLMLGVVIVLLLTAGATAWYFYSANQETPIVTEDPQPEPTPEPQPEPVVPTVGLEDIETTDATPTISGVTSDPDAQITVTIEDQEYLAVVSLDGSWEVSVTDELKAGTYSVTVAALSSSGIASAPVTAELIVKKLATPKPQPKPKPEVVPNTGPGSSLPTTGPSDNLYPPQ